MLSIASVSAPEEARNLPLDLASTAQILYAALKATGEAVRDHRGYHQATTTVTFFCPLEAVALAIGVTRQTIYNHLPALVEAGLVSQRAHYCTYRGQTRSDGSLWSVRLNPGEQMTAPKIDHDWLKGHYRDLGEDIQQGRTAWRALQSKQREKKQVDIKVILSFVITPPLKNSNKNDCKTDLETLLDVPYAPLKAVNEAVDQAARAIGQTLGTGSGSLNMWRWLVWALLRLERAGKGSYWYQVYLLIQRVGVDRREGACKNAGGLLVARLKKSPIWDELRRAPPIRVGTTPMT